MQLARNKSRRAEITLFWPLHHCWNIGHGDPSIHVQLQSFHVINNHQVRTKCAYMVSDKMGHKILQKVLKSPYFHPCISWNIGHGDPYNGVQLKVFHIINIHQMRIKCALNWWNVRSNTSKSVKNRIISNLISPEI